MIVTPRSPQPPSPRSPIISHPLPFNPPSSTSFSPSVPMSSHSKKPSGSSIAIAWLNRTSSNTSSSPPAPARHPYSPSKPVRISEPKFTSLFDMLNNPRSGALGSGATIVKTPQEALCGTSVHLTHEGVQEEDEEVVVDDNDDSNYNQDVQIPIRLAPPLESPPLPPIPVSPPPASPTAPDPCLKDSPSPTSMPPDLPCVAGSSSGSRSPTTSEFSSLPSSLSNFAVSPPQPPFEAVLISSVPKSVPDAANVIVSLETSTITHRTTLSTLTSRPSHLSTYLKSLIPNSKRDSDSESDAEGSFDAIFNHHLASSGLSPSSSSIHVFLDRPSPSYTHILTYLRTPSDSPAALPRAIKLLSSSLRLEAILDLRDEARYLDLDELYTLCAIEISRLQTRESGSHKRGRSNPGSASFHTLHTTRQPSPYMYHDPSYIKSIAVSVTDSGLHPDNISPVYPPLSLAHQSSVSSVAPVGWI